MTTANDFLYPYRSYQGAATPQGIVFDANLQEFAQRVSYIAGLENGGKLSPEESFQAIESLWKQLSKSRNQLGIG